MCPQMDIHLWPHILRQVHNVNGIARNTDESARIWDDENEQALLSYMHASDCDCFVYIAHPFDASAPAGAVELARTVTGLKSPDIVLDGLTMYVAARDTGLAIFQ